MSKWLLPKPDLSEEKPFRAIARAAPRIPFGYKKDEENRDILLPIQEELEALEQAKKLLKEYSLREVADWLTRETGRTISHEGLRRRIKLEHKRKGQAEAARVLAKRLKEAQEKAAYLQAKADRLGSREE